MTSPTKSARNERGIALLSVIALLIIFLIFAGAVMTQLAQEINSSKTNGVSVKALSAADAGIHAMVLAIEENISLGKPDPTPFTYAYPEPGPRLRRRVTASKSIRIGSQAVLPAAVIT